MVETDEEMIEKGVVEVVKCMAGGGGGAGGTLGGLGWGLCGSCTGFDTMLGLLRTSAAFCWGDGLKGTFGPCWNFSSWIWFKRLCKRLSVVDWTKFCGLWMSLNGLSCCLGGSSLKRGGAGAGVTGCCLGLWDKGVLWDTGGLWDDTNGLSDGLGDDTNGLWDVTNGLWDTCGLLLGCCWFGLLQYKSMNIKYVSLWESLLPTFESNFCKNFAT